MRNPIPYTSHSITREDEYAVLDALRSGWIAGGGPYTEKLEAALCDVAQCKYAVATNSGTSALFLSYLASGVGPGKTVLTSPVSFVATANAASMCGAEVKFGDHQPEHELSLFTADHTDCDFWVPVSYGGEPFLGDAPKHLDVIHDWCHGPIKHDKRAKATCLSFHAAKHVAAGEGGAILTNDSEVAHRCRMCRDHGRCPPNMQMYHLGFNYRLSDINAALALSQLERYEQNVSRRRHIAARYNAAFMGKVETVPHSKDSARHLYQIMHDERDRVRRELSERGVGSQVHYEPIIPLQPYYRERFGYKEGDFPNAERYAARTLSIPLFPSLTEREIEHVIKSVLEVV